MSPHGVPYSQELADDICARIARGETVRAMCREHTGYPNQASIYEWLRKYPQFEADYSRARANAAEAEYEAMIELERQIMAGEVEPKAGRAVLSSMQWRMSKTCARKYGDRATVEHTGANGTPLAITFMGPEPSGLHLVATKTECLPCGTDDDGGDTDDAIITG